MLLASPQEKNGKQKSFLKFREEYQGLAAPSVRGEEFFDAGSKYHVPARYDEDAFISENGKIQKHIYFFPDKFDFDCDIGLGNGSGNGVNCAAILAI